MGNDLSSCCAPVKSTSAVEACCNPKTFIMTEKKFDSESSVNKKLLVYHGIFMLSPFFLFMGRLR